MKFSPQAVSAKQATPHVSRLISLLQALKYWWWRAYFVYVSVWAPEQASRLWCPSILVPSLLPVFSKGHGSELYSACWLNLLDLRFLHCTKHSDVFLSLISVKKERHIYYSTRGWSWGSWERGRRESAIFLVCALYWATAQCHTTYESHLWDWIQCWRWSQQRLTQSLQKLLPCRPVTKTVAALLPIETFRTVRATDLAMVAAVKLDDTVNLLDAVRSMMGSRYVLQWQMCSRIGRVHAVTYARPDWTKG